MKRVMYGILAAVFLLSGLVGCGDTPEDAVTVQAVSMIVSDGAVGMVSRYAGVVVSGQTAEIKKEENKTVGDVFVKEGDWVNEGDTLFTYDMEAMELEKDDILRYVNLFGYNPKYGISGKPIGSITYKPQQFDPVCPLYEL